MAALGILPLLVRHFGDIAGVDRTVWTSCQPLEVGRCLSVSGGKVSNVYLTILFKAHAVLAPVGEVFGLNPIRNGRRSRRYCNCRFVIIHGSGFDDFDKCDHLRKVCPTSHPENFWAQMRRVQTA